MDPASQPQSYTYPASPAELRESINSFLNERPGSQLRAQTQERVRNSLEVIQKALDEYGSDGLALSYNGGKDCLVLLALYYSLLPPQPSPESTSTAAQLLPSPSIYVTPKHPFPQVESFVDESAAAFGLELIRIPVPMKAAFEDYLRRKTGVRAIMVGTRRGDPHGEGLRTCQRTDHGWPDFVRVHPVLEWRYAEVWEFLRALRIPYCELYDQGYTSLGDVHDTHPNPALKRESGEEGFRPAWQLLDEDMERAGRGSDKKEREAHEHVKAGLVGNADT
ncbi:3'-phosphoadenosine 5'-phosphosulfate sulfotransferase [Saitoella coloradoensis]